MLSKIIIEKKLTSVNNHNQFLTIKMGSFTYLLNPNENHRTLMVKNCLENEDLPVFWTCFSKKG